MTEVIEFLTELYSKGLGYSALNTARAALSSIGISLETFSAGHHPLVIRFLRGIFNIRPPKPRYTEIWDVNTVLKYLRTLSPIKHLSLKDLTLKVVMLMGLTNAARVQTLHLLTVNQFKKLSTEFVFQVEGLLKQSRPGVNNQFMHFKAYPVDKRLDVYFVLKEYLKRTESLRVENESKLLISYVKPHKAVTKDTVSRWVKIVLIRSGIDIQKYGPHSIRAASTSKAHDNGVPLKDILDKAGWSNAGTFQRFYKKTKEKSTSFDRAVLQI